MRSSPSRIGKGDRLVTSCAPGEGVADWAEYRETLSKNKDRFRALQLICAATGITPLPHQLRAHISESRHKLLLGGVGSGKTHWSVMEAMILIILNPGCSGAFVSPTYDSVVHVILPTFLDLCDKMAKMGTPILKRFHRSMARADLVGGGSVYMRSANRIDSIRGWNLSWAALDETEAAVGASPDYIFEVVAGRLRDPSASVTQLHCTTTPKGARGVPMLFHRMRQTDGRKDWWVGRASSMSNTHLDASFVESLRQGYSKRSFAQEVLAQVLKPSNIVFAEFERERHVIPYRYDKSRPYFISCDWGYNHPCVLFVQETSFGLVIFDEFVEDEVPEGKLKRIVEERCKALGRDPERCVGDRADKYMMRWLVESFPRSYVSRMKTKIEQNVTAGIEIVRSMLDPIEQDEPKLFISRSLLSDPPRRSVIKSFENYRWRLNKEGLPQDGHPFKDNTYDHQMDAIRMLCRVIYDDARGSIMIGNKRNAPDAFAAHRRRF